MFKDINVYSLGLGTFVLILGGYLQTSINSPNMMLTVLCLVFAIYLFASPIISARNRFEKRAKSTTKTFKGNEALYHTILDNTTEAIISINEDGKVESFNKAAEKLFEYDAWEVIGKNSDLLIPKQYLRYLDGCGTGETPAEAEAIKKDGTIFPVQLSISESVVEHHNYQVCIIRDISLRKNIQLELEKSLEFQEMIINSIPDLIFVKDAQFRLVIANDAFKKLFPKNSRENIIGHRTTDYYDEIQAEEILKRDTLAFEDGFAEAEEVLKFPDGRTKILLTKKIRFYGWDNEPFILGCAKDITELKEKERLIDESENRLGLAIEGGGLGFWDWDIASGKIEFSEGWARMLGYETSELNPTFDTWKKLLHSDDCIPAIERIESYITGKVPTYETEFRMRHKDGSWRWILSRGKVFEFDETGNSIRAVGTHLDITDRLKQQGRLDFLTNIIIQSSETNSEKEFIRSVLGIICKYIHWPIGHAYLWNQEEEVFESSGCWYMEDDNLDHSEFRKISEEITFKMSQGLPGIIGETGSPEWVEDITCDDRFIRNKHLSDNKLHSAFAFPIYVHSRVFAVLEFFSTDVIEEGNELFVLWEAVGAQLSRAIEKHKTSQEREVYMRELETAKIIAQRANIMKSEFLTNMSHEIRTPLNGIIGATDLLRRTGITEDQRKYLDLIYNSGDTLLVLINDVLDLSKIEAGELEILPEPLNIRSLIEDTMQAISPRAENKSIELAINISRKIPSTILADELRLKQIMINLLGNSVKFVEQGYIAVSVEGEEVDEDNITLKITVKDTGIGIPPDKLRSIFDKFAQVDATTTKKYGGTGLGLTITQKLVSMMNGVMGVSSEIGKGTEFWVQLTVPIVETEDNTIVSQDTIIPENTRVLVIDDMAISRDFLSAALSELNIAHDTASDAAGGLALLQQACDEGNPYKTVLMDYYLPDLNGRDIAEKIRENNTYKDTKIILMSSLTKMEAAGLTPDLWEDELFFDYLIKPVSNRQLEAKLRETTAATHSNPVDFKSQNDELEEEQINAQILLVENEMVNQMVATDMLENFGCTVDLAENGLEALDMLDKNKEKYAVVLMDCMMPLMDGFEATEKIREREEERNLPHQIIIAMTANAMTGERDKCLEIGMDDYLAKPVKEADLYAKLKEYIS